MLLLNAFLQGDIWVVWFGNIIQNKEKKKNSFVNQKNIVDIFLES